jgi:sortase A
VRPDEYGSVIPTVDPTKATLALVTCHPKWSSTERMVVNAALVAEQSDQVLAPPSNTLPPDTDATLPVDELPTDDTGPVDTTPDTSPDTTVPEDDLDEEAVVELEDDGFSGGWFDDTAAIPHAIGWGLVLLAVGVGAYFAGRAAKRLYVCFLVGAVPFVVVLYFFFENVNRLLPPGL